MTTATRLLENYLLEQVEGMGGADAIVKQLTVLCQKVGYAEFRLAGQLLHRLKVGDRWREHASQPHSFDQLVASTGLSRSEVSDYLTWHEVIWPYVLNELELDPQAVFATLGKTKCRRLTPILRSLIEDDFQSHSGRIRRLVGQIQEQAQRAVTNQPGAPRERVQRAYADYVRSHPGYHPKKAMVRTALSQATTQTTRDIEGAHLAESIPCRVTRQPLTQGEEEFHIYTLAFKATQAEWNRIQRALEPLARLEIKDLPGV